MRVLWCWMAAAGLLAAGPIVRADEPKPAAPPKAAKGTTGAGHYDKEVLGFKWKEADSVDGRWNEADVGDHLASLVALPNLPAVAKGLTVRVGDGEHAGAMCYDTERLALRAVWSGGFLKFDPRRFGLINSPTPAGEIRFATGEFPGWTVPGKPDATLKFEGHFIHDGRYKGDIGRVVLRYRVGDTPIEELPGLVATPALTGWVRTLSMPLHEDRLEWNFGTMPGEIEIFEGTFGGKSVRVRHGERVLEWHTPPGVDARWVVRERTLVLSIEPFQMSENAAPEYREKARARVCVLGFERSADDRRDHLNALLKELAPSEEIPRWTKPGNPRWTQPIVTKGVVGTSDGPYAVDTLTLPFDNPYKALFFASGHGFFSNGDIALCTAHGDVWRVSNVTEDLGELRWKRFATGLFQPLGLVVRDDQVYVLGRDQITRLHDENDDGEADFYENFHSDIRTSTGGHDYVTCLDTDDAGNFYYAHALEGAVRVSADGKTKTILAGGLRNPNGLGVRGDGLVTIAPQEGHWTPASCLFEVRPGNWFGFGGPKVTPERPLGYDPPLCWFPRLLDNSSGGEVWAPKEWGPLGGQLLHLSYGQCKILPILRETDGDKSQGVAYTLPEVFESGIMRGRFSPHDGQLYVSGLKGWTTAAVKDGCLQRYRATGKPALLATGWQTYKNGVAVTFSRPLDKSLAQDVGQYRVLRWNYRYASSYGSEDYRVEPPHEIGRSAVTVKSATVLDDGATVFLETDPLEPVHQFSVEYALQSTTGEEGRNRLVATLNFIPDRVMPEDRLVRPAPDDGPTPEVIARLKTGLKTTSGDRAFVSRMIAGTGPSLLHQSGWLQVPVGGDYEFTATGAGRGRLTINDEVVFYSDDLAKGVGPTSVRLRGGYNAVEWEYASGRTGGDFRVWWRGSDFAREPIPPTSLWHDPQDEDLVASPSTERGHRLWERHRCAACHAFPPTPVVLPGRLPADWLAAWLADPSAVRPHASMPRLFDAAKEQDRQKVADLVAWLGTEPAPAVPDYKPGTVDEGLALYEDLGCIACHRMTGPGEEDEWNRATLAGLSGRYSDESLREYLERPERRHVMTAMPNFHLSSAESAALSAYLLTEVPHVARSSKLPAGDPKRGPAVFTEAGCVRCHVVEGATREPSARGPVPLTAAARGCLAPDGPRAAGVPHYGLTGPEREDLLAFLKKSPAGTSSEHAPGDRLTARLTELRCNACHAIDGQAAAWGSVLAEESDRGKLPESLPPLTWAGEKLRAEWAAAFIGGTLPGERPRPWLKARMPAFPGHADELARLLAASHGVVPAPPESVALDEKMVAAGKALIATRTGLDCRQCHAVGADQPQGDEQTRIALGVNLLLSRDRLRKDYYRRFVLDPPRYDIGTRMPKLSPDGRTTRITTILDGQAEPQFEAIWQYLHALPAANAAAPPAPRPAP